MALNLNLFVSDSKKLEWGEVERIGMIGDGGRDILIHTNEGTIVIECVGINLSFIML